ncbi:MAG: flagellar hook-basal body protein [Acidobacteriota bacterium]
MDSAIYNAASGMIVQQIRLDVTANNLANINTPGFQRDGIFVRELVRFTDADGRFSSSVNGTVVVPATFTTERTATPVRTGDPTDLVLFGPGLFAVETRHGVRYTRNGSFSRDDQGYLVNGRGDRMLGQDGPLKLPRGDFSVQEDGTISVAGNKIGRLRLVEIPTSQRVREGEGMFLPNRASALKPAGNSTRVQQGFREGSAVRPMEEMVELITAQRAFQTYERVMQLIVNEVDRRAVSDIAGPA